MASLLEGVTRNPLEKDFAFQWGTSEGDILSVQTNWTITIIRVMVISLLKMSSMYSTSCKTNREVSPSPIISNHYKLCAEDEAARLEIMRGRRDCTIILTQGARTPMGVVLSGYIDVESVQSGPWQEHQSAKREWEREKAKTRNRTLQRRRIEFQKQTESYASWDEANN